MGCRSTVSGIPAILIFLPDQFGSIEILDEFTLSIKYLKKENLYDTKTVYYPKHLLQEQDPSVRKALTAAINRKNLLHILNLPDNTPIIDVLLTKSQIYRGEIPEPLPYDPKLSRQLLDKAGWRDVDGDGIRERNGQKFHFTATAPEGDWSTTAVYVQDQLCRL